MQRFQDKKWRQLFFLKKENLVFLRRVRLPKEGEMWCYTRWHSRNIRLLYCRYAQEGRSPRGDVFLPSVSAPSSVARVIKAPLGVSHPAIGNRESLFLSHAADAKRVRESFWLIRLSLSPSLSLSVSDYCHQCRNRGGGRVLCEMYKVSQYYFPPTLLELSF